MATAAERSKARRLRDPDGVKAKARAWYLANKAVANAASAAYRKRARLEKPWIKLLQIVRQRAAQKGIAYDLTAEWAAARWTGACEMTGLPFDLTGKGSGPKQFSPSVDRIDSSRGYTQDNCRFILFAVNAMKCDGSDEAIQRIAKAILMRGSGHRAPVEGIAAH